jgi:galactosamine-6-phosphate isomerase
MRIEYFNDYTQLSKKASSVVRKEVSKKSDLLLCASSGSSPGGLYKEMVDISENDPELFLEIRILQLDEWWRVPHNSKGTSEHYLRSALIDPMGIRDDRYISFLSSTIDPEKECFKIQSLLLRKGPIDLCILGMGKNGQIGFNESGQELEPHCHLATLSEESRAHEMMKHATEKPAYGFTLGIKDILSSRRILLLVSGSGKKEATRHLLSGQITTRCPATFLRLHDQVDCLIMS